MSKVISAYESFTATAIKTKATIPDQSDMTVNGTNVECSNISIAKVHNGIQSSCLHLYGLCTSPRVNKYSGFGPRYWYVSGGNLVSGIKTPYQLGDFAGYNHNAPATGWMNKPATTMWSSPTMDVIFTADINVSEIKYSDITNCHGVALTIWNAAGTSLLKFQILDVDSGSFGGNCSLECTFTAGTITTETTYTGKIYLTDNTTNFLENLGNALCKIPNIDDFTTTVKVYVSTTLNTSGTAGWTLSNAAINLSLAEVSFNDMYINNSYSNVVIQVRLVKQYDGSTETTEFYSGAYTANTHLGSMVKVVHSSTPIPAYGYTAYLEVLEPF